MFSIVRQPGSNAWIHFALAVGDEIISDSRALVAGYEYDSLWMTLKDTDISRLIAQSSLDDLPAGILLITMPAPEEWESPTGTVSIHRHRNSPEIEISFDFDYEATHWKQPWSITEYAGAFRDIVEKRSLPGVRWDVPDEESLIGGFSIFFPYEPSDSVREAVESWIPLAADLVTEANELLTAQLRSASVVAEFDFPDEVKVPCEQYLLYFVQFLSDLGVEATAELQHDVGHILFAVTPVSGPEALERIREALDLYLRLPTVRNFSSQVSYEGDFQIQQLIANIQHLRGQLALASGMLQLKDATIQQQQLTIQRQSLFLSGEILPASRLSPSGDELRREEVLGGTVAITPFEGKGFEINLPEVYRRLRRLFLGGVKENDD